MTARSRPVDGFSLAYDRHGEGPPVVLLHEELGLEPAMIVGHDVGSRAGARGSRTR